MHNVSVGCGTKSVGHTTSGGDQQLVGSSGIEQGSPPRNARVWKPARLAPVQVVNTANAFSCRERRGLSVPQRGRQAAWMKIEWYNVRARAVESARAPRL